MLYFNTIRGAHHTPFVHRPYSSIKYASSRLMLLIFLGLTFSVSFFIITNLNPLSSKVDSVDQLITDYDSESALMHTTEPENFNASELQARLPLLRALYPGGFSALQSSECSSNVSLLVIIHSAVFHTAQRRAIRESWGSELPPQVRLLFLVARDITGATAEDLHFGDVISANFTDTYRNLTLKTAAMLDWVTQNCPHIQFLLKCDDDVFINMPLLLAALNQQVDTAIFGRVGSRWRPVRDETSKYFLTDYEFAPSMFPNFTTGPSYVISGSLVSMLLEAALNEPWIVLEDVFLTGVVANTRLGVRLNNWPAMSNSRTFRSACQAQRLISIHRVRPYEQFQFLRRSKVDPDLSHGVLCYICELFSYILN
ncbi:hypothetical protein B566_EDAN004577 [Ephemera danica]|nr:hypothetical protein B566_EDAN004577 [Ephemera danica]